MLAINFGAAGGRGFMRRTDLVVPAHLVAGLRIPPLAVTTGEAAVVWVDVPISIWRFRRRPAQRLPLDAGSARRARRYLRFTVWSLPVSLMTLLANTTFFFWRPGAPVALFAVYAGGLVLALPSLGGRLPSQSPRRGPHGGLRIPDVPVEVAQQWRDLNPGVTVTDQPAPAAHSRRFYAGWSAGLLVTAVVLFVVLAHDGREDFVLFWVAAAALFVAGCAAAFKLLPPGYIRLERGDH
jgi:hypothetical protein